MNRLHKISSVGVSIICLCAGVAFLNRIAGGAFYRRNFPEKIRYLAGAREPATILLLGTSVTYRHLDPVVIDTAFPPLDNHISHHTVNLGVSDFRITELREAVNILLSQQRQPKPRIVMEMGVSPYAQRKNDRALFSHTLKNLPYHLRIDFGRAFEYIAFPMSLLRAATEFAETVEETTALVTKRGLLIDWWRARFEPESFAEVFPNHIPNRGYHPHKLADLSQRDPTAYKNHRSFVAAHPDFLSEAQVARRRLRDGDVSLLPEARDNTDFPEQLRMVKQLQDHGYGVIAYLPPRANLGVCHLFRQEVPEDLVVIDLCDPYAFEELYETRYRVDSEHLSEEGAQILNRYFTQQLNRPSLRARLSPTVNHGIY